MTKRNENAGHSTADETKFIRAIGRQKLETTRKISRPALLRGYLDGCEKRVKWGGINPLEAIAFAQAQFDSELAKEPQA